MKVYEIMLKVYLLEDITVLESQEKILKLIDNTLGKDKETLEFHNKNEFKNYCFNSFYPLERDGVYKEGKIYTITIRTVSKYLATFFNNKISFSYTPAIKALKTTMRVIPFKSIQRIYSITPIVIKTDNGYWRNVISFTEFENRLKVNLIKKYNNIYNKKIDEDFQLYSSIELKNNMPVGSSYKGKKMLGDKISLEICNNESAQKLAYMALGTGMGEMNARGFGYMGFKAVNIMNKI